MARRLIVSKPRMKPSKGGIGAANKSCFFIHAPMVLFICL
jgi:hypothetical protein